MEERKTNEAVVLMNETTERAVLGTILRYNELYRQNDDVLEKDLFHDWSAMVFAAAKTILDNKGIATPITVAAQMEECGEKVDRLDVQRLVALADAASFPQNLNRLLDYHRRNTARLLYQQSADKAVEMGVPLDETIDRTGKELRELSGSNDGDGVTTAAMAMKRVKDHVLDVRDGNLPPGIMTGFRVFDCNYGIHRDQLVIIAARTGVGKSSAAMNIAVNVAKRGIGVAYYSLEMGVEELWARVMSVDMEMRAMDILYKKMADYELDRLAKVAENYAKFPLFIDENATVRFERLLRSIRAMHQKYGVKLFVVDYLQILKQEKPGENEALSLANMTRELKNIAKELHVAVILLSQLNRGGAKDGFLSKFSLRGSGEIEEAADTVVMIDRPDADPNTKGGKFSGQFSNIDTANKAVFRLDKGRNTGGAEYLMDFNPECTLFTDAGMGLQSTAYEGADKDVMPFEAQADSGAPF